MSGSGFWEGLEQEEQEFWGHSGQTGSTGNFPTNQKEYYEGFDRRIATPVDHQHKYEDQRNGENQTGKLAPRTHKHVREERYQDQCTEVNGKPYHEETMKVTDLRRGGQKKLKNPFANRSSNSFSGGTKIPPYSKSVDCPECDGEVLFGECLRCENYQVWDEQDDGLKRCQHEYLDLESRGYYDGTWDDHPENFDPETFERIQERKQRNEDFCRKMELEREELDRMAEELEREEEEMRRSIDSDYDEYTKNEYDEEEEEEERGKKEEDENEDDYDDEEEKEREKENGKDEDDVEDDYGDDGYGEDDEYDYGEDLDQ